MNFKIFLTLFFISMFTSTSISEELKWHNFNEGLKLVKQKKKPAIIDFYTDWCVWCKKMDKLTFNDKTVKNILLKNYITIKINPEKSQEILKYDNKEFKAMQFSQALGIKGFPATAFMSSSGELITMLPGFIPAETFQQLLNFIKDECYKQNVSFEDYQKGGVKCVRKVEREK